MADETLDDDTNLATEPEGSNLVGSGGVDDDGSNADGLPAITQTDERDDLPKNEFDALKEQVMGDAAGAQPDEVSVNEDVINDEDVQDGSLLHEHSNYDTAMFNHPGGPYLTDVENARTVAYRERRMAQNEDTALSSVEGLDGPAAFNEDDLAVKMDEQRDAPNAAFAEREGKAREAADAQVGGILTENAETGKSVEDILNDKGLEVDSSPSGVNPPPAPEDTVPGLSGSEEFGAPDSADGEDVPESPDTTVTSPNAAAKKKK